MTEFISVDCPPDTQFWLCSNGFRGCCPEDPCESQLCFHVRDETSSSTIEESASETTTTATRTTTATITSTATRFETAETAETAITTINETAAEQTLATAPAITTTEATTGLTSTSSATDVATTTISVAPTSISTAESSTSSISTVATSISSASTSIATTAVPEEITETQPTSAADAAVPLSKTNVNAELIGGVIAGVVCLLLIICLVFFLMRQSRQRRGRQFTLLQWECPNTKNTRGNIEEGDAGSTTEVQRLMRPRLPSTAVSNIVPQPAYTSLQSIPEEQSPSISPLQGGQTDSPQTLASAVSSPGRSPQSQPNSCSKADLMPYPQTPDAIHPAFRQDTSTTTDKNTASVPIPTQTTPSAPIVRRASSTPELSDTGIRLGRLELPATSTRELINIPLAERQRHNAQKQLYRNAGQPSPIITPDGAVLSANFNSLPVDPDSHAMSFMDYAAPGERGQGLRLSLMSKRRSKTAPLLSPSSQLLAQSPGPLSPPPSYRAEWRKSSKEVKEKMKEAFRRKP